MNHIRANRRLAAIAAVAGLPLALEFGYYEGHAMRTIHPSDPPRPPRLRALIAAAAACAALLIPALPATAAVAGQAAPVRLRVAQAPPPQQWLIKGTVTVNDAGAFQNSRETYQGTSALTVNVLIQGLPDGFGNVNWVDAGSSYQAAFTYKDSVNGRCPETTTASNSWSGRFTGPGATTGTIGFYDSSLGGPKLEVNIPGVPTTYKSTYCNGTSTSEGLASVLDTCNTDGLPAVYTASGTDGAGKLDMTCHGHTPDSKWTVTGTLNTWPACAPPYQPSGASWGSQFPGTSSVSALASGFRQHVASFIAAMKAAGIKVHPVSTYRPYERSYLMHFSWLIGHGKVSAQNVPPFNPPAGATNVNICWAHYNPDGSYDKAASVAAAKAMLTALGVDPNLALAPPLESNHNKRLAIDMTTTWTGTVTVKDGHGHDVVITTTPRTGLNAELMAIGKTYSVIHFCFMAGCTTKKPADDPHHWSVDGH